MIERGDGIVDDMAGYQLYDRILEAITRGVVGFFRQSTMLQARRNFGSQRVQEDQLKHLIPFGVKPSEVTVILAYGESGKAGVVRKKFRQLVAMVAAGQVGLIILARYDRLSRNTTDSVELYDLMKEQNVLLMVDGRIYDPRDPHDEFVLGLYAQFAQFENRARARYSAVSRFASAKRNSARIPLPTGLVWANPADPAYRAAAEAAGIADRLDDLSAHNAKSQVDDKTYYVLPFPDREVLAAVKLCVEWLIETGSRRAVVERVEAGYEGWPIGRAGKLPVRPAKGRYEPGERVKWVRVTDDRLYEWLRFPALYGTYYYRAESLAPYNPRKNRVGRTRRR